MDPGTYYGIAALLWGIFIILSGLTIARRNFEPIRSRVWRLNINSGFAVCVMSLLATVLRLNSQYSCYYWYYLNAVYIPAWVGPLLARGHILLVQHRWNQVKATGAGNAGLTAYFGRFRLVSRFWFNFLLIDSYLILTAIITTIIIFGRDLPLYSTEDCSVFIFPLTLFQFCIAIFIVLLLMFGLRSVDDAYMIKKELVLLLISSPVVFVLYILGLLGYYPPIWLQIIEVLLIPLLLMIITMLFPFILSFKQRFKKLQSQDSPWLHAQYELDDLLPAGMVSDSQVDLESLPSCLGHPVLYDAFLEFSKTSWCVENTLFWSDVTKFRALAKTPQPGQIPVNTDELCAEIYRNYILAGSIKEINIDDSVRSKIIQEYQSGSRSPILFDAALKHVLAFMTMDTFFKWKYSDSYTVAISKIGRA